MLQLKFKTKGLERLVSKLSSMETASRNLQPALQEVGVWVQRGIQTNFANQAGPGGIGWLALKPTTVARRASMGLGASPILERTGTLKKSIRIVTNARSVSIGTDLEYGAAHQTGYKHGKSGRRVPARPFIGLPKEGMAGATSILLKHLRESL